MCNMKKKLLIIFPDEWLSHSPTILNLVAKLSDYFEIKVISFDTNMYKNHEIKGDEFEFIKINKYIALFLIKLNRLKIYKLVKSLLLFIKIRRQEADEIIGVDSIGLWVAQKVFRKSHFLSLEIYEEDVLFIRDKIDFIESVAIQTEERYDYLFGNVRLKTFYLQNSPSFTTIDRVYKERVGKKVIYFGNVIPSHSIHLCIEAISNIDLEDISLTIKGPISSKVKKEIQVQYSNLIQSGKLLLDESYVSQDKVVAYLSEFYIGFCFYDFDLIEKNNTFNYISCPSGKLFNYYASGVPVIGSDILGLKSVKDFEAGILLKDPSLESICIAIGNIISNHQRFSENCLNAAAHFDFDLAVEPYQDYLMNK